MKWDKNLEIGNTTIDSHHQELFKLISMLDDVVKSHDNNKLEPIIEFLEHYVQDHFKEEETLMQKKEFEAYEEHKAEHDAFKDKVMTIRHHFNDLCPTAYSIMDIRRFIDQLVHHIKTIDIKIAHLNQDAQ